MKIIKSIFVLSTLLITTASAESNFAFDLYSQLKDKNQDNIFFSPYNISQASVMAYEGAKSKTASEIESVFGFKKDKEKRHTKWKTLHAQFNKKDLPYKLHTANALWTQKNYTILKSYIETVEKTYFGKTALLDFIKASEKSRKTINKWVEEKTENKIKDLLPQGSIDSDTRVVLTSAIYFKGDWQLQFDKKLTEKEDFFVSEKKKVKAEMMRLKKGDAEYNYTENKNLQILEMPYKGKDLSMLVLLPKNIKDLEKNLSLKNLKSWKKKMRAQDVRVVFPKFTFKKKYGLKNNLKKLGMKKSFTTSADFSGINGRKDLYIDDVIHEAFVKVNEEGTEAAAATGVIMSTESVRITPEFKANRPFIFFIQDNETGLILFMGRVANPS